MKVIIDIDDDLYTRLFDNGQTDAFDMLKACSAIRKGTPIPNDRIYADSYPPCRYRADIPDFYRK